MGEIKSAWEIAQEKIKNITVDREAMKAQEDSLAGKKLASRFLDDPERTALAEEIARLDKAGKARVVKGVLETLLANLTLPLSDMAIMRNQRVGKALEMLAPGVTQLQQIMKQVEQFFTQYTEERGRIEESLEAQYAPRLKQKAEALAKQTGVQVELSARQDPEFVALLKKNLAIFDERYSGAVREVKGEIERLVLAAL